MNDIPDECSGAIVVLNGDQPFRYAARDEPVDDADSGWQFSANPTGVGNAEKAQIWTLGEVFAVEPSLRPFIALPYGTVLAKPDPTDEWVPIPN